ncbi:hypothetical protein EE896_21870 (plasmid) [Pantoea eucalypti]|uniref:DUF6602 domain-containing protein n=1 Tax=Pantoea eucalypti TaxID=470933 RepID=A0ABY2ZB20_9GAMM|nr:DUF6602 domain-containing protein [Pantoea eucalypti]QGF29586.1 hypothetical protein EE896_21870 [Pantoea eucalypti]TPV30110.1 hypothetical protein FJW02_20665 [Pantoea eucalypti]
MSANIINKILNHKAKRFKSIFSDDSVDLYFNSERKTFHAAEFGRYRENLTADFLKAFIPGYTAVSTGFIVSQKNSVSTQCDIILYDKELTPLIQDDNLNQFFPADCIKGIGEVKSNLKQSQLKEALVKLAKVKMVSFEVSLRSAGHNGDIYDREQNWNHAYTFLICNKIEGDTSDLAKDIDDYYNQNSIPHKFRHNFVLSLDGNALFYRDSEDYSVASPVVRSNGADVICTPVNIDRDFDRAIKHFAQLTYTNLSLQKRVIMNIMEYLS